MPTASIQEALKGYTPKDLSAETGLHTTTFIRLCNGDRKFVKPNTARLLLAKLGIDLNPFVFKRGEQHRRWSKKARIRVRRSRAMKRAWAAKKQNGHAPASFIVIPLPSGKRCLIVNTDTCSVTRGQLL